MIRVSFWLAFDMNTGFWIVSGFMIASNAFWRTKGVMSKP